MRSKVDHAKKAKKAKQFREAFVRNRVTRKPTGCWVHNV